MVFVAFLRAINVGGRNLVSMSDLREIAAGLGLREPKTVLQSGNLVFESDEASPTDIETLLEAAIEIRTGLKIDFMVRSFDELRSVIAANPYPGAAEDGPSHLLVLFTKTDVDSGCIEPLRAAIKGRETAELGRRCVYLVYPDGIGTSKLTSAILDSKLKSKGTARNWNTLLKVVALSS